jgi:hypothetical protein
MIYFCNAGTWPVIAQNIKAEDAGKWKSSPSASSISSKKMHIGTLFFPNDYDFIVW